MCRMSYFTVNMEHFLIKSSLYTDILFFFSVISRSKQSEVMKMSAECEKEKLKMSVDIFGEKRVY